MRSPRKTAGQSPARLDPSVTGKGGDFQDKEAKAKAEAEKIAAREKAVAKQNREDAAKTSSFSFYSMSKAYSKTMKKRPKATASMQGAVINALGVVVSDLIKGSSQDVEKIVAFAVWGLLLAQVLQPYLAFLNKKKLSKNKTVDSLAKVVVDQLTMSPLLCALFLAYLKATEDMKLAAVVPYVMTDFWPRFKMTAGYWSCMNFGNFLLVPPGVQLLFINLAGFGWAVINAYITTD